MLSNNVTELADAIARLQALLNERIVALSHCDLLFARIDRHELGSLILHGALQSTRMSHRLPKS